MRYRGFVFDYFNIVRKGGYYKGKFLKVKLCVQLMINLWCDDVNCNFL